MIAQSDELGIISNVKCDGHRSVHFLMTHREHIHAKVLLSLMVLFDAVWVEVYEIFGSCSDDVMSFSRSASQDASESVHFHDS